MHSISSVPGHSSNGRGNNERLPADSVEVQETMKVMSQEKTLGGGNMG